MKKVCIIILIITALLGCDNKKNIYTVTFDSNGGTSVSKQKVEEGQTAVMPKDPKKDEFVFLYWSLLGTNYAYNFQTPVVSDITLIANWSDDNGETDTFIIRNTSDWNKAVNTIKTGGDEKSYTLIIEGVVDVPPTTEVEQGVPSTYTFGSVENVSITLKGTGTLALSDKGFLICIAGRSGAKNKLIIDGPILQGRDDNNIHLIRLEYSDLELRDGKITGNTNNGGGGSGYSGGVYIKRGVFDMSGGEISNNISGQKGYYGTAGAVHLSYSTFNLSGGVICNNTGCKGGAVYVEDYDFNMTGGEIKGNIIRDSSPYGGAIFIDGYGSFDKTGGIIYGSDANEIDKNKVYDYNGNMLNKHGFVAYCSINGIIGDSDDKYKDTTLGENDNISTDTDDNWD